MVKWAFMQDEITGNIGLYDEPVPATPGNEIAEWSDPDSPPNAPLNDPEGFLALLYWHIQYDNMEVVQEFDKLINHPIVPGASAGGAGSDSSQTTGIGLGRGLDYSGTPIDYDMGTHGLGYPPLVYVALGSQLISPGYIVQVTAGGGARYVSISVDNTKVWLREYAGKETASMPASALTYHVIVVGRQRPAEGNDPPRLFDLNQATGEIKLGDGRFSNLRKYLQVRPGGSPYGLMNGPNLDYKNGAVRQVSPNGTITNPINTDLRQQLYIGNRTGSSVAVNGGYTGSFTGSEVIQVQAP